MARAKSWWLDARPFTSTQRNSGSKILMYLLLVLVFTTLLLNLSACSASTTRPEPIKRAILMLKVEVYKTKAEVTQVCNLAGTPTPEGTEISGCATKLGAGRFLLRLEELASWCDCENLKTWGHELAHTLGLHHDKDHVFYGGNNRWTARNCAIQ